MSDKDVFLKFMSWIGLTVKQNKMVDEGEAILFEDTDSPQSNFTTMGYDEFYAGAIFDDSGNIVKAFLDLHVAHESNNSEYINKLFKDNE